MKRQNLAWCLCGLAPAALPSTALSQLLFEEILFGGTGDANLFFEFSATSEADFAPGTALVIISGEGSNQGEITSFLDLTLDFTNPDLSFPTNNLFVAQPSLVSGAQPSATLPPGLTEFDPVPSTDTFYLGGGLELFSSSALSPESNTFALVSGFTGAVGTNIDPDGDGVVASAGDLPFTGVYDAVSLIDSDNNLSAQLADPTVTPAFTSVAYADDFSALFTPADTAATPGGLFTVGGPEFDDNLGVSPDGPDGFFRFTDGTPAVFDVNTTTAGLDFIPGNEDDGNLILEFDGATFIGGPDATEEVAIFSADGMGNPVLIDAALPSDTDPLTEGDQASAFLTPGNINNIAKPAPEDLGETFSDSTPPTPAIVTEVIQFGDDIVEPAGEFIAGTSFENESPAAFQIVDEDVLGFSVNGDTDTTDTFIGAISEVIEGTDNNGDGDFEDVFFTSQFIQANTDSESEFDPVTGTDVPGPLGPSDEASFLEVALVNDSGDVFEFDGADGEPGTADDFTLPGVASVVNSTASSDAAGDLGFSSSFIDTRPDFEAGFSDGDIVGVIDFDLFDIDPEVGVVSTSGDPANPSFDDGRDGANVFAVSDSDGTIKIEFDEVDLSNHTDEMFSILIGVENTGFEALDALEIEFDLTTASGTETVQALFFEGGDGVGGIEILGLITNPEVGGGLPDSSVPGGLGQFVFDLAGATEEELLAATLRVFFASSSGAENLIIDDIQFTGIAGDGALIGDFNGDGFVGFDDLNLILLNFGDEVLPEGFDVSGLDPLTSPNGFDGLIGQNELDDVLLNFGSGTLPTTNAIPEPTAAALLGLGGLALLRRRPA
ncbi:MAG: hypothetical protein AAF333_16565 [Planctomycetota bacterium]